MLLTAAVIVARGFTPHKYFKSNKLITTWPCYSNKPLGLKIVYLKHITNCCEVIVIWSCAYLRQRLPLNASADDQRKYCFCHRLNGSVSLHSDVLKFRLAQLNQICIRSNVVICLAAFFGWVIHSVANKVPPVCTFTSIDSQSWLLQRHIFVYLFRDFNSGLNEVRIAKFVDYKVH